MKKLNVKGIWQVFFYSLPIQLVVVQLRKQKAILLFWLILLAAVYGMIASAFGGAYLFLEPEYLGKENFWSSFIVGSALGAFLFAYMITLYINESYRFHFIALSRSPFYTFAYNNSLIPVIFLSLYFYKYLSFHIESVGAFNWEVFEKFMGLFMGISFVFLISASYFFAQKTLIQYFGQRIQSHIEKQKNVQDKRVILEKARKSYRSSQRADSYLLFPFKVIEVSPASAQNFRSLVYTLSQHHGKLLLLQIIMFLMVATLGLLENNPAFQLPAGASILLILSLTLMISGALTFWFRKIGLWAFFVLLFVGYIYQSFDIVHERHQAFGLSYKVEPAKYSKSHIDSLSSYRNYQEDKNATIQMLERWKAHQQKGGKNIKPKAIFVMASGGGLRSAFWTLRVLQYADSVTQGSLKHNIRLMTGASGGMFGLAYFRELHMRHINGNISNIYDLQYPENISKDLLNRISFKYFADLFLPNRIVKINQEVYDRETGYSFDHQLGLNMPEFSDRKLGDYSRVEKQGLVPTVILTPTILNQGRKLYVSASPISFLTRKSKITSYYSSKGLGVEFRRMFAAQNADSLWMTTALRMNATFPFILPVTHLPSEPLMAVMDAGAMDNYGTPTAVKYLYEFREWFAENTSEVIFIQIRDNEREDPIADVTSKGHFSQILTPIDGGYYSLTESRDLSNQYLLQFVTEWFEGKVEIISFEYPRESSQNPASLSFHLTRSEKKNIYQSIFTEENQQGFQLLQKKYLNQN